MIARGGMRQAGSALCSLCAQFPRICVLVPIAARGLVSELFVLNDVWTNFCNRHCIARRPRASGKNMSRIGSVQCLLLASLSRVRGNAPPASRSLAIRIKGLAEPVRALEVENADCLLDGEDTVLADDECDIYGACLWPSSLAIAREIVHEAADSHVVELGCGAAAIPSLTALAAGAKSVVATDWSPLARQLVEASVDRFQPDRAARLQTAHFDVRDAEREDFVLPGKEPCTLLVCADMLYDAQTAHAVGACVAHAVSQGASALVADPGRLDGAGREHFLRGLHSVAGEEAAWLEAQPHPLVFEEVGVSQEELKAAGASLSWCGSAETAVGLLRLRGSGGSKG